MKLYTDFEVTSKIIDLYRQLNCVIIERNTFAIFPTVGKRNRLYIDLETNTLYRWDCATNLYVSVGGGGSSVPTSDNLHFSQLITNDQEGPVTQVLNDTPTNINFASVNNVGTVVLGSTTTDQIVVSEDGWYDISFSINGIIANLGDTLVDLYVNGTQIQDLILYSLSTPNGHILYSWNKKLQLSEDDIVSIKISRSIVDGASSITYYAVDFSVLKLNVVGPVGPQGIPGSDGADGGAQFVTVSNVVVTPGDFTLVSGFYEASIANVNILVASSVSVTPKNATLPIVVAAVFLPEVTVSIGSVKIYATNLPTADFNVDLLIINP